jgi:hypothetical protein
MTSGIGGSGPVGGPRGADGIGGAAGADGAGEALSLGGTGGAAGASGIDRLAADLQAGRIGADEALAQLVAEAIPGGLEGLDRADLQAVLDDLVATDPYLASLAARLGATTAE